MSKTARTFVVREGFDTPDDRFEVGDLVKESQIPAKSLPWLEKHEVIEESNVSASEGAIELAALEGIDLADVKGTGADGNITKTDVAKAVKERDA